MNVLALLMARMSSSRFPGKALRPILGRPMIGLQLERLRRAKCFDALILATSTDPSDDSLAAFAESAGLPCFRGALDDVADRIYRASKPHAPRHVLRIGADCPFLDGDHLGALVGLHLAENNDWTNTYFEESWPDGMDAEIYSFPCLERVWREAKLPSEREHVAPFIENRRGEFRIDVLRAPQDYSHLRWTVDHPEDYEMARRVFEELYPANPNFGFRDILDFFARHPEVAALNRHFARNEGRIRSRRADEAFLKPGKAATS